MWPKWCHVVTSLFQTQMALLLYETMDNQDLDLFKDFLSDLYKTSCFGNLFQVSERMYKNIVELTNSAWN